MNSGSPPWGGEVLAMATGSSWLNACKLNLTGHIYRWHVQYGWIYFQFSFKEHPYPILYDHTSSSSIPSFLLMPRISKTDNKLLSKSHNIKFSLDISISIASPVILQADPSSRLIECPQTFDDRGKYSQIAYAGKDIKINWSVASCIEVHSENMRKNNYMA